MENSKETDRFSAKAATRIDLHTHSTASDGSDTPAQLIHRASREGIEVLALTDHDTIAGLAEGEMAASQCNLKFVRGCEISTMDAGKRVHILGLFIPEQSTALDGLLALRAAQRRQRNLRILEKLSGLGINISLEEVEAHASGSVGRPHIAMVLRDKGLVKNIGEAFTIFLGDSGKVFVPKDSPSPHEAVQVLAGSGALPVMAHPYFGGHSVNELHRLLLELKSLGLAGLECWHSRHSMAQTSALEHMASELGLAVSGGSDYHGEAKPNVRLGCTSEGRDAPHDLFDKLVSIAPEMRMKAAR